MSARSPRRRAPATVAAPAPAGNTMLDLMADTGREQFAMCLEASGALSRGVEAMRAIGQRTAHESVARHQAAARRLLQAAGTVESLALPWSIWQDDLAGASRYWQELAAAALEAQSELLGCACGHVFDSESAMRGVAALEALEAVPGLSLLVGSGSARAFPR